MNLEPPRLGRRDRAINVARRKGEGASEGVGREGSLRVQASTHNSGEGPAHAVSWRLPAVAIGQAQLCVDVSGAGRARPGGL